MHHCTEARWTCSGHSHSQLLFLVFFCAGLQRHWLTMYASYPFYLYLDSLLACVLPNRTYPFPSTTSHRIVSRFFSAFLRILWDTMGQKCLEFLESTSMGVPQLGLLSRFGMTFVPGLCACSSCSTPRFLIFLWPFLSSTFSSAWYLYVYWNMR